MASRNEPDGPNMGGVLFIGFLSLLFGGMLGVCSLISQPVRVLTQEPEPDLLAPGEVYFIRGDRNIRSPWRAKEEAWKARQVNRLIVTEGELNLWSENRLVVAEPKDEEESSGWGGNFQLSLTAVNFRIMEEQVQMVTDLKLPALLPNTTFTYKVVGRFAPDAEGGYVFIPEEGTLGQAPLGNVPVVRELLFGFLRRQFEKAGELEWVAESFAEMDVLETTPGRMVMQRKERG